MKPDGKVVLLGDMNVGKTSLLHRYMERRFQDTVSTVGGAFYLKQWGPHNISIWDTAGERRRGPRRRVFLFFPRRGGVEGSFSSSEAERTVRGTRGATSRSANFANFGKAARHAHRCLLAAHTRFAVGSQRLRSEEPFRGTRGS